MQQPTGTLRTDPASVPGSEDERAVERYRYLLRTAPPERIEQAHAEAFAALTPEQRREVLQSLSEQAPPGEQPTSDEPRALARAATRAEMRSPGTLERSFGGRGGGIGMGGVIGGSLLGSVAGAFIGTAIAHEMLDGGNGGDTADGGDGGGDGGDGGGGGQEPLGQDVAADETRYGDVDGTESGWDGGGGDLGGGDFGGGDF